MDQIPEIIQAWVRQLLDMDPGVVKVGDDGQIEVRLYANKGKVRKAPMIVLNGGPVENITP
jgi:hypothetical protein